MNTTKSAKVTCPVCGKKLAPNATGTLRLHGTTPKWVPGNFGNMPGVGADGIERDILPGTGIECSGTGRPA
jgi:hypothetical protein